MSNLTTIIIVLVMLILAGACRSISDLLAHNKKRDSIMADWSDWWGNSWENKWQHRFGNIQRAYTLHWWYLGLYSPTYEEKFIGSSTIFVFVTDAWHFFNWLQFRCYYTATWILINQIGVNHIDMWGLRWVDTSAEFAVMWIMVIAPISMGIGFLNYRLIQKK